MVVVSVGAYPEPGIVKSQVDRDDGGRAIVNKSFQTSVDNVYANGDIASLHFRRYGDKMKRTVDVQNVRETATHVVDAFLKEILRRMTTTVNFIYKYSTGTDNYSGITPAIFMPL